ncbi:MULTISPECIES: helix-turn-helix domain-containing protein [unclassified Streptomyces]|uniref:helix-turn-helix domain-containing protein n=1 Tax=unclassified Streptomyces TaxID=2593676 RepID=UPI0033234E2D
MESQTLRPGYLTAHQTARVLGVDLATVRQLVRRGHLTRSGGTPRQPWYRADDVAAYAAKRAPVKVA